MSYVTPPTFGDDSVLSASQLNVLSNDIAYLWGIAQSANIPFARLTLDLNYVPSVYLVRHRVRYLKVLLDVAVDTGWVHHVNVQVLYNGSTIYDVDRTTGATLTLDLNSLGLTNNNFYEIQVKARAEDSGGNFTPFVGNTVAYVSGVWESA